MQEIKNFTIEVTDEYLKSIRDKQRRELIIRSIILLSIFLSILFLDVRLYKQNKQIDELTNELIKLSSLQKNTSNGLAASIDAISSKNNSLKAKLEEQEDVISIYVNELEFLSNEVEKIDLLIKDGYFPETLNKTRGVAYYNGHKETWYNLDMSRVVETARQRIAGYVEAEYWIREDGCKMLGNYIMIAADQSIHPYGSIVETSLGEGIVVDTGGFIFTNPYQIDIATDWKG